MSDHQLFCLVYLTVCDQSLVSSLDACALTGDSCTRLHCCSDVDLKLATASVTTWVEFDPCDFTFSVRVEKFLFEANVFNYNWGECKEYIIV